MHSSREAADTRERLIDGELIDFGAPDEEGGQAISGDNRRRFERVGCVKTVRLTELDDFGNPSATWESRIVDLSRGGLGLRSRRMVHLGRSIIIEVPAVEGATKVLFGAVRQCRYAEGEGYAVGVEFKAMPQSQAVRQWLAARGLTPA